MANKLVSKPSWQLLSIALLLVSTFSPALSATTAFGGENPKYIYTGANNFQTIPLTDLFDFSESTYPLTITTDAADQSTATAYTTFDPVITLDAASDFQSIKTVIKVDTYTYVVHGLPKAGKNIGFDILQCYTQPSTPKLDFTCTRYSKTFKKGDTIDLNVDYQFQDAVADPESKIIYSAWVNTKSKKVALAVTEIFSNDNESVPQLEMDLTYKN
jgi:hypothetical protein